MIGHDVGQKQEEQRVRRPYQRGLRIALGTDPIGEHSPRGCHCDRGRWPHRADAGPQFEGEDHERQDRDQRHESSHVLAPARKPVGAKHRTGKQQAELGEHGGARQRHPTRAVPPAGTDYQQQRRHAEGSHQAVIVSIAGELPEHQRVEPDEACHQPGVAPDLLRHQPAQRCRDHQEHRRHHLLPEQVGAKPIAGERDRRPTDRVGDWPVAARVVLEGQHFAGHRVIDLRGHGIERDRQFAVQPKRPHVRRQVNGVRGGQLHRGEEREAAQNGRHNGRRVAAPESPPQCLQADQVEHCRDTDDEANLHHVRDLTAEHTKDSGPPDDVQVDRPEPRAQRDPSQPGQAQREHRSHERRLRPPCAPVRPGLFLGDWFLSALR